MLICVVVFVHLCLLIWKILPEAITAKIATLLAFVLAFLMVSNTVIAIPRLTTAGAEAENVTPGVASLPTVTDLSGMDLPGDVFFHMQYGFFGFFVPGDADDIFHGVSFPVGQVCV